MFKRFWSSFPILNRLVTADVVLKTGWAIGLRGLGLVASYSFTILVIRLYGVEEYGLFASSLAITVLFILLGKAGTDIYFLRDTSLKFAKKEFGKIKGNYFFSIQRLIGLNVLVLAGYYLLLGQIVRYYVKDPEALEPLALAGLLIFPSVLYIFNAEGLRGTEQPSKYVFTQFAGLFLFNNLLLLAAYWLGIDFFTPILVYIIGAFLLFLLSTYWFLRPLKSYPIQKSDWSTGKFFKGSIPFFSANALLLMLTVTGTLAVLFFYGPDEVATYEIGFRLGNIVSLPLMATSSLVAGKFTSLYADNELKRLQAFIKKIHLLNLFLGASIFLLFLFFGKWVLSNFFDEGLVDSYSILLLIGVGYLINTISGSTDLLLQLTHQEKLYQNIMLVGGSINVVLNLTLTPWLGLEGTAGAFTISILTINGLCVYYIRKKMGIKMLAVL